MSLIDAPEGRPVHIPANPALFAFDAEVSAIFPDMAKRAIPNFYEAHQAHARMLAPWMVPGVSILDVGASRGHFIQALYHEQQEMFFSNEWTIYALDNSPDMCDYLRRDYPEVITSCFDITDPDFLGSGEQYDVVCCHYVLQFVHPDFQQAVLQRMLDSVRPGGVFIYGHKAKHYGGLGELQHEEYMLFRRANGYTEEEIQAKTQALKGSMFPVDHHMIMDTLSESFSQVAETFRFMMFSTVFAVK